MFLQWISLINFRNYVRLEMDLSPHITVLQGDNAQGKTNLLEAIYYLATGTSPRAEADRQLLNWATEADTLPYARLVARVQQQDATRQIEITLVKNGNDKPLEAASIRKEIRINGVNRRVTELIGQLQVVLFLPQDLQLIDGPPDGRRRYLDALMCKVDARYYRAWQKYNRVVYQRNHLLRRLRERGDPEQLAFWDRQMIEEGSYLIARRHWLSGRLNDLVAQLHPQLTGQQESLRLTYLPSVALPELVEQGYQLEMPLEGVVDIRSERARIQQAFTAQLAPLRAEEVERGTSLLGPHRDDMRFLVNGVDMTSFGSRGQQRTAALAVKLAEVEWLQQETGEWPVLLLDDFLSELDLARRDYVLATLHRAQQVLITTTDVHGYPADFLRAATLLHVQQGVIEPLAWPSG